MKKILCLVISLIMLVGAVMLPSCAKDEKDKGSEVSVQGSSETDYLSTLQAPDFDDGEEFVIYQFGTATVAQGVDFTEVTGEKICDSLLWRNAEIESQYGVKIVYEGACKSATSIGDTTTQFITIQNMTQGEKIDLWELSPVYPIAVTTVVAIFVPTAVSLVGMLMFGNLIKEIGSDTSRLFDAASNSIMNAATIFLGLCVGATMTVDAFLNWNTIGIVIGGFLAFALSIASGIFMVKIYNLFSKKKINPLVGATGLSAVPMASRVANDIAIKYDPKNHVLNYCMSSNISGVIGSAVAAGVLISFLG